MYCTSTVYWVLVGKSVFLIAVSEDVCCTGRASRCQSIIGLSGQDNIFSVHICFHNTKSMQILSPQVLQRYFFEICVAQPALSSSCEYF